jgi:hypothetical protein
MCTTIRRLILGMLTDVVATVGAVVLTYASALAARRRGRPPRDVD